MMSECDGQQSSHLLSATHPVGRFKARFFTGLGIEQTRWPELGEALRRQHLTQEAERDGSSMV